MLMMTLFVVIAIMEVTVQVKEMNKECALKRNLSLLGFFTEGFSEEMAIEFRLKTDREMIHGKED